jgi:hypothetical protein
MKTKRLILKIIDLILILEKDSSDWPKIAILRRSAYIFSITAILTCLIRIFAPSVPIGDLSELTFGLRWINLLCLIVLSASFLVMAYSYFRHILNKNYPVSLQLILSFYVFSVIIWGIIYSDIYFLYPNFYQYHNPPLEYSPVAIRSLEVAIVRLHFILFSAFQSLNANFYRIHTNSIFPSIFSWVQSLFTLSLVALVISSYVNQKAYPVKKNKESESPNKALEKDDS